MSTPGNPYSLHGLCSKGVSSDRTTSVRIVCDLIRAGISEVCHSRNILPLDCFREVLLHGNCGQTFVCKVAYRSCQGGPAATNVLGGDVIDTWCQEIGRMLLSAKSPEDIARVTFGFSSVSNISVVLEEYLFDICGPGIASSAPCQHQAMEILQSLQFLAQTLDPVPKSTIKDGQMPLYTFVKVYLADKPSTETSSRDRRSRVFTDASKRTNHGISYYDRMPFQMKIGSLSAAHYTVSVGVCSALDSITDDGIGCHAYGQMPGHERVPDNLGMCSSVDNATDAPSSVQRGIHIGGKMETPGSVKGKVVMMRSNATMAAKRLQASPTSSSSIMTASDDGSMTSDDTTTSQGDATNHQRKRRKNAIEQLEKGQKRPRPGRLAGLLAKSTRI